MQCVKKNVGQLNSITDAALRPDKDTTLLAKAEIFDHATTHGKDSAPSAYHGARSVAEQ